MMEKINILPVPTWKHLGVNAAETEINTAAAEVKQAELFISAVPAEAELSEKAAEKITELKNGKEIAMESGMGIAMESGMGSGYDRYVTEHAGRVLTLTARSRVKEVVTLQAVLTPETPALTGSYVVCAEEGAAITVLHTVRSEGRTDAGAVGRTDTGAEGRSEAEAEGRTDTEAEGRADTGAEGRPEDEAEGRTDTGAEGRSEAEAEGRTDAGAEGRTDTGAEGRSDTGAEGRSDTGAEGRADAGAEGRSAELTRIHAAKNSFVRLITVQNLGMEYSGFQAVAIYAEEGARVEVIRVVFGGKTAACGVKTVLAGNSSEFRMDSIYFGDEKQNLDFNDVVAHEGRKTESAMTAAGVLAGESRKILRGTIDFKRGAKYAVGHESEDVLLLGRRVKNRTVPLILCGEESVEGQHAATAGRLPERQIHYLRTRGLTESQARKLLVEGRFAPVIDSIPDEELRAELTAEIERRLERSEGNE